MPPLTYTHTHTHMYAYTHMYTHTHTGNGQAEHYNLQEEWMWLTAADVSWVHAGLGSESGVICGCWVDLCLAGVILQGTESK